MGVRDREEVRTALRFSNDTLTGGPIVSTSDSESSPSLPVSEEEQVRTEQRNQCPFAEWPVQPRSLPLPQDSLDFLVKLSKVHSAKSFPYQKRFILSMR